MKRGLSMGIERTLYAVGAVLLCVAAIQVIRYQAFQLRPQWFASVPQSATLAVAPGLGNPTVPAHQIVGRVEIPRLSLGLNVIEGDDEDTLALSAGHVPGSAQFGASGNAVVAGHRETAFRPLRNIRSGDLIRAYRAGKTYDYEVESTRIVKPDDVSVLRQSTRPVLTLITCYPFRYVGDAPHRFIVTARMISH
mgnify:CR=1 FL=1